MGTASLRLRFVRQNSATEVSPFRLGLGFGLLGCFQFQRVGMVGEGPLPDVPELQAVVVLAEVEEVDPLVGHVVEGGVRVRPISRLPV